MLESPPPSFICQGASESRRDASPLQRVLSCDHDMSRRDHRVTGRGDEAAGNRTLPSVVRFSQPAIGNRCDLRFSGVMLNLVAALPHGVAVNLLVEHPPLTSPFRRRWGTARPVT